MRRSNAVVIAMCLVLAGTVGVSTEALALDVREFDVKVANSLTEFDRQVTNADEFLGMASGVLVCPEIKKVGLGVGLERGACALQIDGKTVEYYRASSASIGLTAGIQGQAMVLAFMNDDTLKGFRSSRKGWEAGVDGSVAVARKGRGGKISVAGIKDPVVAVAYSQKGLMGDLSVAGTRYKVIGDANDLERQGVPFHRFVVTADVADVAQGASRQTQMTIDIEDWITESERHQLRNILKNEGQDAALEAMGKMGTYGTIKQPGKDAVLQYAHATKLDGDRWRVTLGTYQPVAFTQTRQAASKLEDNVSVIQLDLDAKHVGTGVIQMGPEFGYDPKHGVTIKQRTISPIKLTSVSYKKFD